MRTVPEDDLNNEIDPAFAGLTRERDPGRSVEERVVATLRRDGGLRGRAKDRPTARRIMAIAAGIALFTVGLAAGEYHARLRDTRALLKALFPKLLRFDERWGMRDDAPVLAALRKAFGDLSFESMKIPLHLAATDFNNGEQVVLSSGSLVDAIRASIAIPFVFKPWKVGDRLLMDGFLSDPLPVGVAIKEGADVIIAMGFESPYQTRIDSPARFAFQLSSVMTNNLLKSNFAFHNIAHHSEVIPIVPVFSQRIRLFDTEKIPAIIEDGERAAEEQIPYLKRLLGLDGAAAAAR